MSELDPARHEELCRLVAFSPMSEIDEVVAIWLAQARAEGFDAALASVTRGVQSAKKAHADHGHRQIVSALGGLEQAIPRTVNPYRDPMPPP